MFVLIFLNSNIKQPSIRSLFHSKITVITATNKAEPSTLDTDESVFDVEIKRHKKLTSADGRRDL